VIGVGVSGLNAAAIAADTQAEVILLDLNTGRLRAAGQIYRGQIQTLPSSALEIEPAVLGSGLIPGAKAPILIANELVARMKPDSVLVDISIDQGGCFQTRPGHPRQPDRPSAWLGVIQAC